MCGEMRCARRTQRLSVNHSGWSLERTIRLAVKSLSEVRRVRYLLGLSSPAERERIEAEYFEDEDAFEDMLTAEDDLIDEYARGELGEEERRRFEKVLASSLRGSGKVKFARAFAGSISASRSVETKFLSTSFDILKTVQLPGLLRIVTIAAALVCVAMFAWLVTERSRMINELLQLRAKSTELGKRTEALQQSNDTERSRGAELTAQLADLRAQSKPPDATVTQRARHLLKVKNNREEIAKPEQSERAINIQDATLGNTFVNRRITELPRNANNVSNLLSLQPGTPRAGYVAGGRADQTNITLDGIDIEPPNTYFLMPRNIISSGETPIRIRRSLSWIRFQLALETAAIHIEYRVIIKTADGHLVTSDNWIEPLTPNQTIIDTPAISTADLPGGSYLLSLMGQEPDGSWIEVAAYSFRVTKIE